MTTASVSRRPFPRRPGVAAAACALLLGVGATRAFAQFGVSSTTTTTFGGTTTTTMFEPTDVTGGGQFEGRFPKKSFDYWTFTLAAPRVLVAEISNGFGGCPADSVVELRQAGYTASCMGSYGPGQPCLAFDDDSGPSVCSRLVTYVAQPGEYWIKVFGYDGSGIARYFLDVEFVEIACGNSVVELTEGCDDGNTAAGDCCSPTCQKDPVGTACNDGVFCNGADQCTANAACATHVGDPCPGPDGDGNCAETCNEAAKSCTGNDPNGTTCQDALFCNGPDTCSGGLCSVHAGNPCPGPDGDGNCSETCNEASDACTAPDANGAPCNDGLFCNGADTCSAGACSTHAGNPCDGPDGDLDCSEVCDETADACTGNDPDGSSCDDGLFCNGTDNCISGFCNQHAGAICPGIDGDADCKESCSDTEGGCTGNDPNGAPCNDGIFCNGADRCSNGSCSVHLGNPCPGPDGDGSCSESCDEATDTCTAADPNASACNDGIFCNGADTCVSGACNGHAGNPCAGADGDANCSESCDETADNCLAADPNGSACSDGLFCNGADNCVSGFCNQHAGSPCAGADGDANCSESCNEDSDNCLAADPNASDCNDGLFCNGADKCLAGQCSQHAGNPCDGSDGDIDCSEVCNEIGDNCNGNDPDGSACNDLKFCNGADSCQSGSCTGHAGDPCSGPDGDANCAESCLESNDTCTGADPNGSACQDGSFCNGSDTCLGGTCSGHAGSPCNDSEPCTADSCDEDSDLCSFEPIDPCTTTTLPPFVCGDVSGDGSVKAGDALSVLKAAVGGDQCATRVCVCDVNASGTLQASDALLVLKKAVDPATVLTCAC